MPGTKNLTKRRRKRRPPTRGGNKSPDTASRPPTFALTAPTIDPASSSTSSAPTTSRETGSSTQLVTATQKKLCKSPTTYCTLSSGSESESDFDYDAYEGKGTRLLEVSGLQSALQGVCCKECGGGPISFRENFLKRQGLCTEPFLFCENCSHISPILFSTVATKVVAANWQSVLANKCVGGSHASLQMFFAMLDLPPPVSRNIYSKHMTVVREKSILQAEDSLRRAREEVREHYGVSSDDQVADVLISCDGTWQRRGFSSLFGAVFIISYETGKVLDYIVLSKHCAGCRL